MRKKLILSLALLTVVVIGSLAGCGEQTPAATPTPAATIRPAATPTTEAPPMPGTPLPGTPRSTPARGDVEILENTVTTDFPKTITFKLRARSNENITRVTLGYTVDRITVAPVTNEVRVTFEPGAIADAKWVWDMRKGGPPGGAQVLYEWILDVAGSRMRTEKKNFAYQDPRFEGKSALTVGDVTLYWYQGDREFGQTLMDAAQEALKRLAQDTGSNLERPVKIYIYPTYTELRSALVFPQEWTGGVAFTEYRVIAIGVPTDRRSVEFGKRTVSHELAHQVTFQVTFNPYGINMPTWLSEGLSKYAEGEPDSDEAARLDLAKKENKLFSVRTLSSSFSADTDEALLSYAESGSFVRFLVQKYGRDRMLSYLGLFRQGVAPEDGLKQVYGFDYDGLDTAWRSWAGARPKTAGQTAPVFAATTWAIPLYSP